MIYNIHMPLVIFFLTFFLTIIATFFFLKIKNRNKFRAIKKKGVNGETIANKWLSQHGFFNIKSQISYNSFYIVNGKKENFSIRPDFIATKKGKNWIIEVKTGKSALLNNRTTRRQIREYVTILPNNRYALFDATKKKLYEISFNLSGKSQMEYAKKESYITSIIALLIGITIGFIITFYWIN